MSRLYTRRHPILPGLLIKLPMSFTISSLPLSKPNSFYFFPSQTLYRFQKLLSRAQMIYTISTVLKILLLFQVLSGIHSNNIKRRTSQFKMTPLLNACWAPFPAQSSPLTLQTQQPCTFVLSPQR